MRHRTTTVAGEVWNVGSTSGHGIPQGKVRVKVFRFTHEHKFYNGMRGKVAYASVDGLVVTRDEYERLMLVHGFTFPFFRKAHWSREKWLERARLRERI